MNDRTVNYHRTRLCSARLASALRGLLNAANVGERTFWNAANEAKAALAQWEDICADTNADTCDKCGGSGGGDDPVLRCNHCFGSGLKR